MPVSYRPLALIAVCGLALSCTACNSNSKKIVGKWKVTSIGDNAPKDKDDDKMVFFIEFKGDSTGKFGVEINDAKLKELIGEGMKESPTFKWKVSGDKIELSDMSGTGGKEGPFGKKDKASGTIKFDGNDTLTLTPDDEKDKPAKLSRMK